MNGSRGRPTRQTAFSEVSLRAAAATVQRDPSWWQKCLLYGAAALSGFGLPLAAGFVMESFDNSRRGFPVPLPPWGDFSLRWLAGLLVLLIDFAFFVLPLLLGGMLLICGSVAMLLAGNNNPAAMQIVLGVLGTGAGLLLGGLFLGSTAPVARLRFAREGRIEEALSVDTVRWALAPAQRELLLRARLASLPAYGPALLLGAITFTLSRLVFPAQLLALLAGGWLTLAALVYAHLVVVQLYVTAERELQRRALGM